MNVFESLRDKFPELAQEWHPYKNESLTPDNTAAYSNKRVWWYLEYDDPATGKHFALNGRHQQQIEVMDVDVRILVIKRYGLVIMICRQDIRKLQKSASDKKWSIET